LKKLNGQSLRWHCYNKNGTHRLGNGGEEVDAIVPGSRSAWINEPEVRLVYQGRACSVSTLYCSAGFAA
jgi:hypothetical protein